MLSRVAEAIYWMNRYVERAENIARVVDVNLHLEIDLPPLEETGGVSAQWQPLVWTTGDEKLFIERYREGGFSRDSVIAFLTFDVDNPNSILSCVRSARENARSIREVISSEMWFTLNRFYLMLRDPAAIRRAASDPHSFYAEVKMYCMLFLGESMTTMSHGEGWHFGRLGRMIERADKTSRILDVKYFILLPKVEDVGMPLDTIQWAALLKSASALEMYRKVYSSITPKNVSKFLILDRDFPRAILYCLSVALESLRAITRGGPGASVGDEGMLSAPERHLGRMLADLHYAQIDEIIKGGFHEYLDTLQVQLNRVDDSVYKTFFEVGAS